MRGLRASFLPVPPEVEEAVNKISAASDFLIAGEIENGRSLIVAAEHPAITAYVRTVTDNVNGAQSSQSPYLVREVPGSPEVLPKELRAPRNPTAAVKRQVISRDGWRCRVCGVRVADKDALKRLIAAYPAETRWASPEKGKHQTLRLMWAVLDHVIPWARGGSSSADNLVVACNPCNYGRANHTFDEVGFADPFSKPAVKDGWDGLTR
jgi:Restriction endonuclease